MRIIMASANSQPLKTQTTSRYWRPCKVSSGSTVIHVCIEYGYTAAAFLSDIEPSRASDSSVEFRDRSAVSSRSTRHSRTDRRRIFGIAESMAAWNLWCRTRNLNFKGLADNYRSTGHCVGACTTRQRKIRPVIVPHPALEGIRMPLCLLLL